MPCFWLQATPKSGLAVILPLFVLKKMCFPEKKCYIFGLATKWRIYLRNIHTVVNAMWKYSTIELSHNSLLGGHNKSTKGNHNSCVHWWKPYFTWHCKPKNLNMHKTLIFLLYMSTSAPITLGDLHVSPNLSLRWNVQCIWQAGSRVRRVKEMLLKKNWQSLSSR